IIIGGGPGGLSAAVRARRLSENAEIIVFEKGQYVSYANCGLPYHIGGVIPSRESLILKTPEYFMNRFKIDIRISQEITSIDPINKTVTVHKITTDEVYLEKWDRLLLSTGASPVIPPLPGLDTPGVFSLRNITDMDSILGWIEQHKVTHATIVGGGFIGLEVMEALRNKEIKVTVVEMGEQVMSSVDPEMVSPLHKEIRNHGVDLRLKTALKQISKTETGLCAELSDRTFLSTDMVILAIGVKPENKLAVEAGVLHGETGGIKVNSLMQTSVPDIYAVGDTVETNDIVFSSPCIVPLAGPVNRQGRIAADNMLGGQHFYLGTQGTSICKAFSLSIASCGVNEKQLKTRNIRYEKIYVHATDHATYYPDSTIISLKLLFSPDTGKIFGAQISGQKGIDKRIDILSVAQRAGLSVEELADLELAYAPPFNSARDIINQAGMVAENVINGHTAICHVNNVLQEGADRYCLVDIRSPDEIKRCGEYPGALCIPLDSLRSNIDNLPKNKEIVIGCQSGLRGHIAYRILQAYGFKVYNLSGGFLTWQSVMETLY
ncbi:FAD-dependent oxidoreductase, partial [Escherichia coli]|nr:FAD-dependent oxidoreductase [Escherichia coli]